ncbi:transcription initiation factor TFIID subunit 1-like [Thrips palmi]|uniref:Transcription initiation factor TFIID subunit 1-like n=1 Tax=Thrips palmi TaxID=161013 RepID=A0A6P8Y4Q9_THRPL|nr:transcription initiation factor TFIID subunit 1-like [Thrips palmi]
MAEGDDDKEADVTKHLKRPPDYVPLKLIIKRKRPDAETPSKPTSVPKVKKHKRSKVKSNKNINNIKLPSKYAGLTELAKAFEKEQPKCLQEVWHSSYQRWLEEEEEEDKEVAERDEEDAEAIKKRSYNRFISSGMCDFGAECEMPWLHPTINVISSETCKQKEVAVVTENSQISESRNDCESREKDLEVDGVRFVDWRYGAAKFWYDTFPEGCKNFMCGFKLQEEVADCGKKENVFADDAYLMVSQIHWEDDVIWNGADVKPEVAKSIKSKWFSVGGKESVGNCYLAERSFGLHPRLPQYLQARGRSFYTHPVIFKTPYSLPVHSFKPRSEEDSCKPILPYENEDLVGGLWEKEIIWDAENMPEIPKHKITTIDPSDENFILGIPEDVGHLDSEWSTPDCVKLSHPYDKCTKIVVGKTGISNITDEGPLEHFSFEDPFNVSNDSYYALKSSETSMRLKPVGKVIQHSIPVLDLRTPFIPTNLGTLRLQNFHRPALKKYSHGLLAQYVYHPVYSLTREICLKAKQREEERQASGGGDFYFMREPEDLSGRDGEIVLVEFSEENPLLMNEVGMCSKIINYYKRKASKDHGPPELKYGEVVYPHTSPFLGTLSQGQCIQAVENNLYRCPIFEHKIKDTDFLVIRNRHSLSIREIDALFAAGQQCPLYEVPAPHSRCATNFSRDFLQVTIFRMFLNCPDQPPWVRMDEIKKAFPLINDLNIRKCLKLCSDFKRVDALDSSCWVLRPDFRLPSEEEMRSMVTPEQCCAQFSMLAAEQRLKDAGYGGNFLFVPPDEDEDDDDEEGIKLKIDDEVKAAPWNLTRGFIQSLNGKCLLDLTGPADPTGCGEGFSYLTRPNRPKKQMVTQDTDHHIEKPTVASAKVLLKKMGVPDKEVKSLSTWELLEIARTISKKKMKGRGKFKIPKPKPMTTVQHVAKYREECQRLFDLQNQVLQSVEELSTDEEELSDDDEEDVEEMGKIVEKLISNGRSYNEVCTEREEREREELVKMMMEDNAQKQSQLKDKHKKQDKKQIHNGPRPDRVLKINRTFRDSNGKEYTRVEFVRKSSVIDIYLKIRGTKDEAFISQFAALESAEKQKILKEKREIERQLLRLKQQESKLSSKQDSSSTSSETISNNRLTEEYGTLGDRNNSLQSHSKGLMGPPSRKVLNSKLDAKRRCGACGNPGHKRGNKVCPQYCGPVNVAMTEEEEEEYQRQMNVDDQNLVNVDGTKLKLSVKLIKRAEEMKKKTLVLRVPKDIVRKRKRPVADTHCDYLENKFQRTTNRRRVDPLVVLSNAFELILNEIRDLPDSDPFHFPVNTKTYPHYTTFVSRPMDLQTIRGNLRKRKYQSRKDFLEDVHQIVHNSSVFNGAESPFTINATKMLDLCVKRMGEQEEELIRLEETINPLDDENYHRSTPQRTPMTPARDTMDSETIPKSILDLTISDTEDEGEPEASYLDGRACPVVP